MGLTDTGRSLRETLTEREVRGEPMAGRDLPAPDVTASLRARLAQVPEWQRERFLAAMTELLGEALLGAGERVVGLIEIVERQVSERQYEYRCRSMNAVGHVVAPATWSRTRVEAVQACADLVANGGGVVVAVICRGCFAELPDPASFPAGSRYACRCGLVHERGRFGVDWRPADGR